MTTKTQTLADHAEAWWREQGNTVPPYDTLEWAQMYQKWVEFAFAGFADTREDS